MNHSMFRGLARALLWLTAAASAHAAPTVTVSVQPRIGLFHETQYVRTRKELTPPPLIQTNVRASWTPLDRRGFLEAVQGTAVARRIEEDLGARWEILTTYDPAHNYGLRKVRVAVADGAGPKVLSCRVFVDGLTTIGSRDKDGKGCELEFELFDNAARAIDVSYRLAGVEETQRAKAQVPQDFLLVIAGDSYASGEGNPDRPCGGPSLLSCGTPALWMDEECHRSFWSAGMQTALRMIRQDREQRHGAYTVVNVACSGAGLGEGIVQGYGGVVSLRDAVKRHEQALKLDPRGLFLTGRKITPQLEVLEEIAALRPFGPGIDLLIVSAGGNDLQFGAVVVDSIVGNRSVEWAQQTEEHLRARLRTYGHAFRSFAARLREVRPQRVVWIPYPNITSVVAGQSDSQECAAGPFGGLDGFTSVGISPEERMVAHRILVMQLNDLNEQYAKEQGYTMLDRGRLDAAFKGRGWCSPAASRGAYESSDRVVRKADESVRYQGALHGAMHPTFEGHQLVQRLLEETLWPGERRAGP